MSVELATLVVEAIGTATALLGEATRRHESNPGNAFMSRLQEMQASEVEALVSPVKIASFMRGSLTAALAKRLFQDVGFRNVVGELVLAAIVQDRPEVVAELRSALQASSIAVFNGVVESEDAAHFGGELAEALFATCQRVVEAARSGRPDALAVAQQIGLLKRVAAILDNAAKQSESAARLATSDSVAKRRAFVAEYRKLCAEAHGFIRPPDFEHNRKVPMESLYVVPTVMTASTDGYRSEQVEFEAFYRAIDRTVLLGDPGGGKSTFSDYMALRLAKDPKGPLPLHVILRDFGKVASETSILDFLQSQLGAKYQIAPPGGLIEDLLLCGEATVIFDGLDELIDTTLRRSVTNAVELFSLRYPLVPILVTSRRVGYSQAALDPSMFQSRYIGQFAPKDVSTYVTKWFGSQDDYNDHTADKLSVEFIQQSQAVPDLRSNPLMLSLMCIIFRGENFIPRNRPAIYEKCATLLFEKWDGHRQIEVPLQAGDYVDAAMKHLALKFLLTGVGDSGLVRSELVDVMTKYLFPKAIEDIDRARKASEEFIDFCQGRAWVFTDAGTTATGEPIYTFTHRTFLEYFAALQLVRTNDSPERLAKALLPHVAEDEWDVVAQLAVQQSDKSTDGGTERALRAMLDDPRRRKRASRQSILSFLTRCMQFAVVSPAYVRDLSASVVNFYLHSPIANEPMHGDSASIWFHFTEALSGEHLTAAVDAQRVAVLQALDGSDSDSQLRASQMICFSLMRGLNIRFNLGSRTYWDVWTDLFVEIAVARPHRLREYAKLNPFAWSTLPFAGLQTARASADAMAAAGLDFGQRFFSEGYDDKGNFIPSSPYGLKMIQAATGSSLTAESELRTQVVDMAQVILDDFSSEVERKWAGPQKGLRDFVGYASPNDKNLQSLPVKVRDAFLIANLAFIEGLNSDGLSGGFARELSAARESKPRARKIDLDLYSDEISDFLKRWLDGSATVFAETPK